MVYIIKFLKKLFGETLISLDVLAHNLAKCAKCNSYVETFSSYADSLHNWIKSCYEVDFKRAFEDIVRFVIKKQRISRAQIAFDITSEPFYGKARNLHIFNTPKDKKYDGEFHFITCSLINKGFEIPLMALPVRLGEQTKLTIELVAYCKALFPRIYVALFDRGFYIAELVDFLEAQEVNYLMLVPQKKGKIAAYVKQTEKLSINHHKMHYSKDKSTWKPSTNIVICKDIADYDWIFATNIQFKKAKDYVYLYKRRWQIETNYRVQDEAHIKSKSSSYMIRYFYFLCSMLLQLLWIIHKKNKNYVPFKKYLDLLEYWLLNDYLKIMQS